MSKILSKGHQFQAARFMELHLANSIFDMMMRYKIIVLYTSIILI